MSTERSFLMLVRASSLQKNLILRAERMLIAPCCYTQSVDVHSSEIAETMRQEVATMVFNGGSEQEIFEYYKSIYGERILMIPDGRMGRAVLATPLTMFALGSGFLAFVLRRVHHAMFWSAIPWEAKSPNWVRRTTRKV